MPAHMCELDALLERYCETRDIAARNAVLVNYLYIADIVARRFSGRGVEYDDLYQVASMALLRALERYECGYGVRFQTFATPSVIGEVRNYFRDKARVIRAPRRSAATLARVSEARERLTVTLGRTPTPYEMADAADMPVEELLELLDEGIPRVQSLDAMVSAQSETALEDYLGGEDEHYDHVELKDYLERVIETLSPLERDMVVKRFFRHMSQSEVAQSMNVSQMSISRMERRVLDTFRREAPAYARD